MIDLVKASDLRLYQCYEMADPVIGFSDFTTVIVKGKVDKHVVVSSVVAPDLTWTVSEVCLFREV